MTKIEIKEKINCLLSSNDKEAYESLLELEQICETSDILYQYIDVFIEMLKNQKSYVRVRGFRLICALAKWDRDNIIDHNIDTILRELDDEKATSIRQFLSKIALIIEFKSRLKEKILKKVKKIDISKYKESVQPLISEDVKKLLN